MMNPPLIYEDRNTKIISPTSNKIICRNARFLQPFAENPNEAADIPHVPILSEVFPHDLQKWPSTVTFKGWKHPQKEWGRWVQALAQIYKRTWERSGIYNAILCSTHEYRCNPDVVLGLVEFWCPETSTFLFPWGEATVTLEDIMVLGGYPVSGKPVQRPLSDSLRKLVDEMDYQRREFGRLTKSKKASHGQWLKRYKDSSGYDREFEHVAFLSLWLSRYVFPRLSADDVVGEYVIPIAAQLSRGISMALGPPILANLYKDLTFIEKETASFSTCIAVAAPFQLLQIWAYKRFPSLCPNWLRRAACWNNLKSKVNLELVKSTIRFRGNFVWRPFCDHNSEFKSFDRCLLQATELVGFGLDCKVMYQPQRVAMQFGFDQHIPGRINHSRYHINGFDSQERINFTTPYMPGKSIQPGVSIGYWKWWKDSMSARQKVIREILARNGSRTSSSGNVARNRSRFSSYGDAKGQRQEKRLTARNLQKKFHKKASSPPPAYHRNDHHHYHCIPKSNRSHDREEDEIDLVPISKLPRKSSTAATTLNQKNPGKPNQGPQTESNYDNDDHVALDFVSLSKRIKRKNTCEISRNPKEKIAREDYHSAGDMTVRGSTISW